MNVLKSIKKWYHSLDVCNFCNQFREHCSCEQHEIVMENHALRTERNYWRKKYKELHKKI